VSRSSPSPDPADRPASKHRGYAFLTFANPSDAADAIDNFDLNELPGYTGRGNFLKCNVAQPNKYGNEGKGDKFDRPGTSVTSSMLTDSVGIRGMDQGTRQQARRRARADATGCRLGGRGHHVVIMYMYGLDLD
jgi:RNA recognition motif-containing protein